MLDTISDGQWRVICFAGVTASRVIDLLYCTCHCQNCHGLKHRAVPMPACTKGRPLSPCSPIRTKIGWERNQNRKFQSDNARKIQILLKILDLKIQSELFYCTATAIRIQTQTLTMSFSIEVSKITKIFYWKFSRKLRSQSPESRPFVVPNLRLFRVVFNWSIYNHQKISTENLVGNFGPIVQTVRCFQFEAVSCCFQFLTV